MAHPVHNSIIVFVIDCDQQEHKIKIKHITMVQRENHIRILWFELLLMFLLLAVDNKNNYIGIIRLM